MASNINSRSPKSPKEEPPSNPQSPSSSLPLQLPLSSQAAHEISTPDRKIHGMNSQTRHGDHDVLYAEAEAGVASGSGETQVATAAASPSASIISRGSVLATVSDNNDGSESNAAAGAAAAAVAGCGELTMKDLHGLFNVNFNLSGPETKPQLPLTGFNDSMITDTLEALAGQGTGTVDAGVSAGAGQLQSTGIAGPSSSTASHCPSPLHQQRDPAAANAPTAREATPGAIPIPGPDTSTVTSVGAGGNGSGNGGGCQGGSGNLSSTTVHDPKLRGNSNMPRNADAGTIAGKGPSTSKGDEADRTTESMQGNGSASYLRRCPASESDTGAGSGSTEPLLPVPPPLLVAPPTPTYTEQAPRLPGSVPVSFPTPVPTPVTMPASVPATPVPIPFFELSPAAPLTNIRPPLTLGPPVTATTAAATAAAAPPLPPGVQSLGPLSSAAATIGTVPVHHHPNPQSQPQPATARPPLYRKAGSLDGHHLRPHQSLQGHQSCLHRRPPLLTRPTFPAVDPRLSSTPASALSVPANSRCSTPRDRRQAGTSLKLSTAAVAPPTKPAPAPNAVGLGKPSSAVAMPGLPAGDGTPNAKRPADDSADDDDGSSFGSNAGKLKIARMDRGEDFSKLVKNRLQSYTRTGQACDRCKIRKIRCDALPEGCSHCIQQGIECRVTDRVTGRTERRGYLQQLERDKVAMFERIRELERLLDENGVQVQPWPEIDQPARPPEAPPKSENHSPDELWKQIGNLWIKDAPQATTKPKSGAVIHPNFPRCRLESRPENTNLGVGWDSSPVSSIKGTELTIMGTTIDTAVFDAPDMDDPPPNTEGIVPLYNKSVQAYFQSSMGVNPPLKVELPSRDDAFTYAQWYFLIMANYFPTLHKPTFMNMLARIYDEPGYSPPMPELVQVHMVFAIIYYQYGVRNWQETERRNQLNDLSNKHYHFSLSKMFDLMISPDLAAIQAMTLMACHTRCFPKPGCGALISSLAFQRALELNLHRAPKVPKGGINLDTEMRKRTWWVMISMYVSCTGRRGRPMPITVEEFDVPFPEPINDDRLHENGVEPSRGDVALEWDVGMAMFKMVPLLMEMHSNIYSARSDSQNYAKIIYALEDELQKWEDELPAHLKFDPSEPQNSLACLYTRQFGLEMRLWMRHNSVNPTSDVAFAAENTRVCEETARQLLIGFRQLLAIKSLDTTWTQMSIFSIGIFSMLVAHWERRFNTTPEDVAALRKDMDDWMEILAEVSHLLCCGTELQDQIRSIIDRTLKWIEDDMPKTGRKPSVPAPNASQVTFKKEHSAPEASLSQLAPQPSKTPQLPTSAPPSVVPSQQHLHMMQNQHSQASHQTQHQQQPPPQPHPQGPHGTSTQQGQVQQGATYYADSNINGHEPYQNTSYPDQGQGTHLPNQGYNANAIFYPNSQQAAATAAAVATASEAHPNHLMAFAPQATQQVGPNNDIYWGRQASNTWQDWTTAIVQGQNQRYGTGNLIPATTSASTTSVSQGGVTSMADRPPGSSDMASQWPLVMFDQPEHHPPESQLEPHSHQQQHHHQNIQQHPPQHQPQHQTQHQNPHQIHHQVHHQVHPQAHSQVHHPHHPQHHQGQHHHVQYPSHHPHGPAGM